MNDQQKLYISLISYNKKKKRFVLRLHYNGSNEKAGLKGVVIFFSVDFNPIDANDILDTHKK